MESQFGACAVRISRQNTVGQPSWGVASGALCINGGINKFKHDFAIEKGKEIYETDACGHPVVIFKLDDVTKWATFELTLAKFDDRMVDVLGLGAAVGPAATPTGHVIKAGATCGAINQPTVTIELWRQRKNCAADGVPPLKRVVLPKCKLQPQGFDSNDAVALPVFSGQSFTNNNFDNGPFSDLDDLHGVQDWCYAEVVDDQSCSQPDPYTYTPIPAHIS